MINKPAVANYTITMDVDIYGNSFQAVDSPCELVACMVSAAGGAAAVRLYDTDDARAIPALRRVMIAANQGESTPFCPAQPMKFTDGIYVVFEQGGVGQGSGEITLVVNK
jgi:hypothetical protein